MKRLSILAFFTLIFVFAKAEIIPEKKAALVARNIYQERASLVKNIDNNVDVSLVHIDRDRNNNPVMYYYNINQNQGFVIVSADDRVIPVVGYSFEGGFVLEDMPANISSWLNNYKQQIVAAREMDLLPDTKTSQAWQKYSSPQFLPAKNLESVNALCSTLWDQGCFYNALCPQAAGGDCNRVWTGCVATAMAQIMKYHNFPDQGIGSHSYTHNTYGPLTANFGSTTYNWTSMPNQVWSNNTAVATLMFHAGVSVEMDYGVSGSGAQSTDVRNALVNYFGYSTATLYGARMWYSATGWENLLKADIDAHHPIYYSGSDPSFGHAFVCDGYQANGYFHFNWGWSGSNNGFFTLNNMNSGNGTFNQNQAAVLHISPPGAATGIDEKANNVLTVYPNPSQGILYLKPNNSLNGSAKGIVLNSLGEIVKTFNINFSDNQTPFIDLSQSPNGLYLIRIEINGKSTQQQFTLIK